MFQFSVLINIYNLRILSKITVRNVESHLQCQLLISGNVPDRICVLILLIIFLTDGICQFLCRHSGFLFPVTVSAFSCTLTCRKYQCPGPKQGDAAL